MRHLRSTLAAAGSLVACVALTGAASGMTLAGGRLPGRGQLGRPPVRWC